MKGSKSTWQEPTQREQFILMGDMNTKIANCNIGYEESREEQMLARTDHLFAGKLQLKLQKSVRPMANNVKRDITFLKDLFIA